MSSPTRVTAYSLIMFYVVLNISLYVVAATEVFPDASIPAIEDVGGTGLYMRLVGSFLTLGLGALISALTQNWLFGAAALVLWALQFFLGSGSIFHWVFYGLPNFLTVSMAAAGVDASALGIFSSLILAITSVVWFWFIASFASGRVMEQ